MNREQIRATAINEFGRIFEDEAEGKEPKINPSTDAIIVLSGHGLYDNNGQPITWVSPENIVRIGFGIDILKKVLAFRLKKNTITSKDIREESLFLYLNGEGSNQENIMRAQLDDMQRIALSYNFPPERIALEDCVIDGKANTLTQFTVINSDPRLENARHITMITSDYHDPRVERTTDMQLRPDLRFDVLPAPQLLHDRYNVYERITGELDRIVNYSQKGDISPVRIR